ncbi:hypothetical protein [Metabacillus fastidiosus]
MGKFLKEDAMNLSVYFTGGINSKKKKQVKNTPDFDISSAFLTAYKK